MKNPLDKELFKKVLAPCIVVCVGIAFYFILLRLEQFWQSVQWFFSIFRPFVWGFIIAYLVNFLVRFCENRLLKKIKQPRTQRVIALIISYTVALVIITLFMFMLIPQTVESLSLLIRGFPGYISNLENFLATLIDQYHLSATVTDWIDQIYTYLANNATSWVTELLPYTLSLTASVAKALINLLIALVISMYFLGKKEKYSAQCKKLIYSWRGQESGQRFVKFAVMANKTFSDFLVGKILDSAIIGVLCFCGLTVFGFPFPLLVSVIVGATNIIPFFGPFIGAIPSFLIILIADPIMSLWFLLFIFILQQLDGNIIGPKILGFSIGVSALWILFSIIIGGKLFGFIGMVLGVPAFAITYSLCSAHINRRLEEQGLPTDTKEYAADKNKIRF